MTGGDFKDLLEEAGGSWEVVDEGDERERLRGVGWSFLRVEEVREGDLRVVGDL